MEGSDILGDLVETADGSLTLRHPDHAETYHSTAGAETEARELYIARSGIGSAFAAGRPVRVLDVGLGLAYNAMATLDAWVTHPHPGDLDIISLEHNPELIFALVEQRARWANSWPAHRKALLAALTAGDATWTAALHHPANNAELRWTVLLGDAHDTLRQCPADIEFVWQDPFSPEKNPSMWGETWFSMLKNHCRQGTVLMSYSVARSVRDALAAAGWTCERIETPVRQKKHWLRATPRAN